MPLHDWTDRGGWEGLRHLWITELLRWIKPRLPEGYRAYIGTAPMLAVGAPAGRPDMAVRSWHPGLDSPAAEPEDRSAAIPYQIEPDEEIAVATLDPETLVLVERAGRLVVAVEVISPRNKDRPIARSAYLARYLGYLLGGVNLVLIDVHRRPIGFSFANRIAEELQLEQPAMPAPMALSYRVGEPAATGGRQLALWRRPFAVGAPLPVIPLALSVDQLLPLDLETTYSRAATDAYLD